MTIKIFHTSSSEAAEFHRKFSDGYYIDTSGYVVMMVCNCGSATYVSEEQTVEFSCNTGIFFGDGKFRITDRSEDFVGTVYMQEAESFRQLLDTQTLYQFQKHIFRTRFFYMDADKAARCCIMFKKTADAYNDKESHYREEIASCHLRSIIYNALDILEHQKDNQLADKRENIIVDSFIKLLKESHGQLRKVKDYADIMGLSSKHLSANVLAATKKHASTWIDESVLREVKYRLEIEDGTIQDISHDLNFSTPSHLTKFFREKTGMTPLAYRRKALKK